MTTNEVKDIGVYYGIYSKEYAEAVKEMNAEFLSKPNTLQNKIAKILWHRLNRKS